MSAPTYDTARTGYHEHGHHDSGPHAATSHAAGSSRRTVMLAPPRSTYLVGPVSGLQLTAAITAIVVPFFLLVFGIPAAWLLMLTVWQACAITAIRLHGRTGWQLLGDLLRRVRRASPQRAHWHAGEAVTATNARPLATRGAAPARKPSPLLAAGPGRLGKAQVIHGADGDVFVLPMPGGQTRAARASAVWRVQGPSYALLPPADQDAAITAWAGALNRLATLPGLIGISVHQRAESATALDDTRSWHAANASDAVPVAAAAYAELLDTVDARDPSSWLVVTFDPRRVPGKLEGLETLIAQVPPILAAAGVRCRRRATASDVTDALLDLSRSITCAPPDPTSVPVRPVFPPFDDTAEVMSVGGVHHAAIVATTSTAVGVDGDLLAPLFAARADVETTTAITIRPLNPDQTQARARARQVKLRRQHHAAMTSSMSGMLIDTHRVEQELATLAALGADAVRGAVETELVITAVITGGDVATVLTARDGLMRDAAPLRFTPVAFPAPTVAFTRAPLGGLL